MKLIEANKDEFGYHYVVHVDEAKPAEGENVRTFDYGPLPPAGFTEATYTAMQRREIKALLSAGKPVKTDLPQRGATL